MQLHGGILVVVILAQCTVITNKKRDMFSYFTFHFDNETIKHQDPETLKPYMYNRKTSKPYNPKTLKPESRKSESRSKP